MRTIDEQVKMIDDDFNSRFSNRIQSLMESAGPMHATLEELKKDAQEMGEKIRAAHRCSLNSAKIQYSAFVDNNEVPRQVVAEFSPVDSDNQLRQPTCLENVKASLESLYQTNYKTHLRAIIVDTRNKMIETQKVIQFQKLAANYASEYPISSDSLLLYTSKSKMRNEKETTDFSRFRQHDGMIPFGMSSPVLGANSAIINSDLYFDLIGTWECIKFMPYSKHPQFNRVLSTVWPDFRQSIEHFRLSATDYNTLFLNHRHHSKQLQKKREELYSNLFLTISVT